MLRLKPTSYQKKKLREYRKSIIEQLIGYSRSCQTEEADESYLLFAFDYMGSAVDYARSNKLGFRYIHYFLNLVLSYHKEIRAFIEGCKIGRQKDDTSIREADQRTYLF